MLPFATLISFIALVIKYICIFIVVKAAWLYIKNNSNKD